MRHVLGWDLLREWRAAPAELSGWACRWARCSNEKQAGISYCENFLPDPVTAVNEKFWNSAASTTTSASRHACLSYYIPVSTFAISFFCFSFLCFLICCLPWSRESWTVWFIPTMQRYLRIYPLARERLRVWTPITQYPADRRRTLSLWMRQNRVPQRSSAREKAKIHESLISRNEAPGSERPVQWMSWKEWKGLAIRGIELLLFRVCLCSVLNKICKILLNRQN